MRSAPYPARNAWFVRVIKGAMNSAITRKTKKMPSRFLVVLCASVLWIGACGFLSKNTPSNPTTPVTQSEQQPPSCQEKHKPCKQDADCCSLDCAFNLACLGKCCFP